MLAACLVVTVEATAVEPGTIWRVGVAWRADGGRVAGVFGVGVCCRPERRPATSGSVVVFEVTMVEVTVMPEVGVTMELMTEVAEVAAAVVLDVLVELTGVELLVLPLVFVLTLSTRIDFFAVEITWVSSSPSVLLLAMTVAEAPLTFLAFAGVEVPFLLSAVTLAFLFEAAAVDTVPEVAEWLLSIEIRLISDLSDLVEESVSRLLRFPLLASSSK